MRISAGVIDNRFKLVVAGILVLAFVVVTIGVRNVARKANTAKATDTAAIVDDATKITKLQLDNATPLPRLQRAALPPATKPGRDTSAALNMRRPEVSLTDELIRVAGTDTVSGTVYTADKSPLPGATVSLLGAGTVPGEAPFVLRTTTSDAQGSYTLTKLNGKVFDNNIMAMRPNLVASKEGFIASHTLLYKSHMTGNDFVLHSTAGKILGEVIEDVTSKPLAGVTVYFEPTFPPVKSVSDAVGKFACDPSVPNSTNGIWQEALDVRAVKADYCQKSVEWIVADATKPQDKFPRIIMAAGGGTVSGTVIDTWGKPMRGTSAIYSTVQ